MFIVVAMVTYARMEHSPQISNLLFSLVVDVDPVPTGRCSCSRMRGCYGDGIVVAKVMDLFTLSSGDGVVWG